MSQTHRRTCECEQLLHKLSYSLLKSKLVLGLVAFPKSHSSVSQTFMLADSFWLRKITTDPHILAHLNIDVRVMGSKATNLYIGTDFR